MKISFCITCMGRLHHLKETILKNIQDNSSYGNIEYVLLDYNSQDGLESWVKDNLGSHKNVVYWRERSATRWRMPHAKNVAHLLASGDIVCNLDADNWTGKDYALTLAEKFSECPDRIVTHVHGGGFGGRVALRNEDFKRLRGYDEQLSYGWGWEDDDLKARAKQAGLDLVKVEMPGDRTIGHDDSERIKYMPEWTNLREAHGRQCEVFQKRRPGDIINPGGYGKAVVYRGFDSTPQLMSDTVSCR